jgi:hypothetical protein
LSKRPKAFKSLVKVSNSVFHLIRYTLSTMNISIRYNLLKIDGSISYTLLNAQFPAKLADLRRRPWLA